MSADPKPFQLPDEPFEKILARISRVPSPRAETETHIIYREPRISAPMLARYVVSDAVGQKTIIKNSKFAAKGLLPKLSKARHGFASSFDAGTFDKAKIAEQAAHLTAIKSNNITTDKENKLCADALKIAAAMPDLPSIPGAQRISRPANGWGALSIAGVEVSLEPQVVFSFINRKVTKVGGVFFHPSKTNDLAKELHGHTAGEFMCVLLMKMLEEQLVSVGVPLNTHCFTIDVHRKRIHNAPKNHKKMFNQLEAACDMIAAMWSGVELR